MNIEKLNTGLITPIPVYEKLTLTGQAHWSARGELESTAWNWWFEIKGADISDEKMRLVMLEKETGVSFIQELQPYLPILLTDLASPQYITAPSGIPGGTWDVSVPLKDCKDPEAAEKIFRKYFPLLCEYL